MSSERDIIAVATPLPLVRNEKRKAVIAEVARLHDVSLKDMLAPSHIRGGKCRPLAHARFHAMARLQRELGYSLIDIGKMLGGRDHATVKNGIARWQEIERGERVV